MVSNIGETSLDLSWTNSFDGLSPITGVTVKVFDGIVRVREIPLTGDSSLQSTQIPGLNEFTLFNITVTVNNAVGSSESAMISAMTLSLSKCVCVHVCDTHTHTHTHLPDPTPSSIQLSRLSQTLVHQQTQW